MPRHKKVKKRQIAEEPLFGSKLVAKLINRTMKSGKKSVAQKQIYQAFELVREKTKKDPIVVFNQALENIKPQMEVRPRRIGGAAYQVPMPVRGERKETLAIRWLIKAAQKRSPKEFPTFSEKLSGEIIDASNGTGGAVKKKEDTHRMAEANKAFAHFRW
ncbi:MAG: 30S ribosomal protein S7 [Patescibacteria group bacterium]